MLIIQHRANDPYAPAYCDYAEIDVHIGTKGIPLVGHEMSGKMWDAKLFLEQSKFKKFFIDIKQNLAMDELDKIHEVFKGRSMGFFDIPFPSAYYAHLERKYSLWGRFSEHEPLSKLFDQYWIDPLASQDRHTMLCMLSQTQPHHQLMICSPELHGHDFEFVKSTWSSIKFFIEKASVGGNASGLVTKYVDEAKDYFNE